ncbi:hypothetical protein AADZ91_15090 [Colwelliaceae bacterium 6441]
MNFFKYLLLLIPFNALAEGPIKVSAFGTFGLTLSDSNIYGYRQDISYDKGVFSDDFDFLATSLLGGQLSYNFNPDLDFIGQVIIRDLPDPSLNKYISLGFLRYTPNVNWSIRLGRTAPDIFLITEYRNVNIAYTWAEVPNEVYGIIPFKHIDGLDITYKTKLAQGTLNTKFFTGETKNNITFSTSSESLDIKDIIGLSLSYETTDWTIQARHTNTYIGNEHPDRAFLSSQVAQVPDFIWPNSKEFSNKLTIKNKKASYSSISAQIQLDKYLLTTEFTQINSNSESIPKVNNGYVSITRQFDNHALYGIYGFSDSDKYKFEEPGVVEEAVPELINYINQVMNVYSSNQQTISLGWRWDFSANVSTSLQLNHTKVDNQGGTLWQNPTNSSKDAAINTLFFNVSFSL